MYLWIKALHVIAVIAWMAGQLYLPRLFVYHATSPVGSPQSETFKVMEEKLMRIIMNPAMIVTWLCGITMIALNPALLSQAWLIVKLVLVLFLSGMHGVMSRWRKEFAADRNTRSQKFYRMINEVPTLALIVIVIMVIVRPF
ncbi:MAG TPA: protoporphyrinogen oxidase HemJ [Alphaproteobacteria bacterium]|nr:protoporphyrinogen oxidase HemJ [Alphaproteobacteria bacterium]